MRVFRYLSNGKSLAETYKIYNVIRSLKNYAVAKYNSSWEDALDEAFFHIVDNFDESKGDLEHYATRVVGTILLGKNKKELANSEQTELSMDLDVAKGFKDNDGGTEVKDPDVGRCLRDMVNLLTNDVKFFITRNHKHKKMDYGNIFKKYEFETIQEVEEYLTNTYRDKVSKAVSLSRDSSIRDFSDDRYINSIDATLEYRGVLNDVVLLSKRKGAHDKKLYHIDIKGVLQNILDTFYSSEDFGKVEIEDKVIYVTLSGNIVNSMSELMEVLERELVGSILSRTSLKVISYNKGHNLYLSSTKDSSMIVNLPIFGSEYIINMDRVVFKEVV